MLEPASAWREVELVVIDDFTIQVRRSGRPEQPVGFQAMGFSDRRVRRPRSPVAPTKAWKVLLKFADSEGRIQARRELPRHASEEVRRAEAKRRPALEKRIQEIRARLRALSQIEGDPIPYVPTQGVKRFDPMAGYYVPAFKITRLPTTDV